MTRPASHILLIGCGKMGSAMLQGWLGDAALTARFSVIEPFDAARAALPDDRVQAVADAAELAALLGAGGAPIDMVVLAVKPQMMAETLDGFLAAAGALVSADTAYLSIAAGITGEFLTGHLGADAQWLRSMPNTPAAIGEGITAFYAPPQVSSGHRDLARQLLGAIGAVEELDDEALMDAVTALSGSGPAYVFLLAEVMAQAGHRLGLPADLADRLARQTVSGAGALIAAEDMPTAILRENVTSKGGTTAAALAQLMAEGAGMAELLEQAMDAAHKRSRELSG